MKKFSHWVQLFQFVIGCCFSHLTFAQSQDVLSRYTITQKGWANTTGGAGGQILRVTTLASSGPGSLKEALHTPGKRIIVFEVGGVIDLQGQSWKIKEPFLTIAGQTAPDPGITLIKGELEIQTNDVIVQHLMFRPGEYGRPKRSGGDHDGLNTTMARPKSLWTTVVFHGQQMKIFQQVALGLWGKIQMSGASTHLIKLPLATI